MSQEPFIQKLTLRNFRSIRNETVTFANPLFLVGRNGSGKSNFVDALAFISECMSGTLQSAAERRGGLGRIGYFPHDWQFQVSLRADFQIGIDYPRKGFYAFTLKVTSGIKYEVTREQCKLNSGDNKISWFDRRGSQIESSVAGIKFQASPSSLVMPLISGIQDFTSVYQSLAEMRVYNIDPGSISGVQNQEDEELLKSNGSNIGSVIQRLWMQEDQLRRVDEVLQSVVPGVTPIPPDFAGGKALLYFEQEWPKTKQVFEAAVMSTGTLYALGLVVAALQEPAPSIIAIEEPELNIHPGALEAISDIIKIASQRTQVVVTTHSPDLLDAKWLQPENLRVVEWEKGATHISELGEAPIEALKRHLMGAGELLRANALDAAAPKPEDVSDPFQETLA